MKEYTDDDFDLRLSNNNSILNAKKKESTRNIEMYIGYLNHTWDTVFVPIPLSTPEEEIEKVATDKAIDIFYNSPNTPDEVVFIDVYNIPEVEEV